ncbi:hypothetical protein MTO96_019931 [Rhipicephalus appendiculatus]
MANQLFGVNPAVQLGPPNGPNEPLPPNPQLNEFKRKPAIIVNVRPPGPPNWSETLLEAFEKNLYREHFRTAGRSPEEVEEYRVKNGISIVSGRGVPKPLLHYLRSRTSPHVWSRPSRRTLPLLPHPLKPSAGP